MEKRVHDELTLFRLIALGDECAFEQVFELYKSRLVSYLTIFTKSAEEAKELTQEIFLRVWITREKLSAIESPESYLFVMARNKALDYLRKASLDSRMRANLWRSIRKQQQQSSEEAIFSKDTARLVDEAIYKLSRQQQAVFRLSRMEGLTHDQIALQLSISKNTVKNHIVASLKFIRNYLSHNY